MCLFFQNMLYMNEYSTHIMPDPIYNVLKLKVIILNFNLNIVET